MIHAPRAIRLRSFTGKFLSLFPIHADGILPYKPKSAIRHAVSVSDGENEAFGLLARYAFGQARSMLHDTSGQSP